MAVSGNPPIYTRGYSFTQHSIDQPTVPQPGDKLDAEYDDIATCIAAASGAVDKITNPDGTLADHIVGMNQLAPGLFDQIVEDARAELEFLVDDAEDARDAAGYNAQVASQKATAAASSAAVALSAASTTTDTANAANYARAAAQADAMRARDDANRAANSESTADAAMQQSLLYKDLSFKWAEYIAGPVEPAPPGWPEAIDDGMWSSKWWALRARDLVGAWGGMYLGAYPEDPAMRPGNPYPPGTIYFNTTSGEMMVWDGSRWVPISNPAPAINASFVYVAAANQTAFFGPDYNGNTPLLEPTDPLPSFAHLNGVLLVEDKGRGIGDFVIDPATSTLTLALPVPAGSILQWDLLLRPEDLAPSAVNVFKLFDVDRNPATNTPGEFNGVRTTFPLYYVEPGTGVKHAFAPGDGVQLAVHLDGVPQESGADFTTSASNIVFAEAPPATTRFWGRWYAPPSVI